MCIAAGLRLELIDNPHELQRVRTRVLWRLSCSPPVWQVQDHTRRCVQLALRDLS
jgi:hypothetical protein